MRLDPFVEAIQRQLATAAETGGPESRALASQLAATLDSAVRLALQDALASAANEISCELAPVSVELRLRGRDPEFVVVRPPTDSPERPNPERLPPALTPEAEQGEQARINLRLPERLKMRVESAATAAGLSLNAWLVRTAALATEEARNDARGVSQGKQNFKGWVR